MSVTKNGLSQQDLFENCKRHMADNGLPFDGIIQTDGNYHRYSIDSKKNEPDEWYVATEGISVRGNPYLICTYGTWSQGTVKHIFKSYDEYSVLDEKEKKQLHEALKKQRLETEKKLEEERNKVADQAENLWSRYETKPKSKDFLAYATFKGIEPIGAKFGKNPSGFPSMVIPLKNIEGQIRSLQYISLGKDKKSYKTFLRGGEKKGNFFTIGELIDGQPFYISEGYATGISVHVAQEQPVVIAFGAGDIDPVLENLRKKYPTNEITIAGDNDETGIKKAEAAARKYNCKLVFPEFPEDTKLDQNGKPYKDFNDLHQLFGLNEVQKQLSKPNSPITAQDELKQLATGLLEKNEPCDGFSISDLPKQIADYIESLCEMTNAHPIMITSAVIVNISAFLKKRVYIPQGEFFQKLYTNQWHINVTKSGQFKTSALEKGFSLARQRSNEITSQIKPLESQIKYETEKNKKAELKKKLIEISKEDVLLPNKITAEALLEHLSQGHSGATMTSEFGAWLQNMDKSHNSDLKAIFTELYDVPAVYRYKTKDSGDFILEEPFFAICGVTTLSWLKNNLKPDDVQSGFFARFLVFAPPHQDEIPPALPKFVRPSNPDAEWLVKKTLENMDAFYEYRFSPSARNLFVSMHESIYRMAKSYSDKCQQILDPYLKRWSPYILKIAMVMRLFEDSFSKELSDSSINSAMSILLPAIRSTASLFEGELGESDHQRKCRIVFDWICQKVKKTDRPVKWKDIISSKQLEGGSAEYGYICTTLVESGKLICTEHPIKKEWSYVPNNK